jgi:signal transduction histidine kinase
MSDRIAVRLAWSIFAISLALLVASIPLLFLNVPRTGFSFVPFFVEVSAALVYISLGTVIVWRQPRNPVGWILVCVASGASFDHFSRQYVLYSLVVAPGSLPFARVLAWLGPWIFQSLTVLLMLFLLLFPTGHLPSPKWRPIALIIVFTTAVSSLATLLTPGEIATGNQGVYHVFNLMPNPTAVPAIAGLLAALQSVVFVTILLVTVGVLASLVWRLRRGRPEEREQVKWLVYTVGVFCIIVFAGITIRPFVHSPWVGDLTWGLGAVTVVYGLPAAATVAILKYHLYDIDVVISRSLVFGALAVFISAVYITIVAGIGTLAGAAGRPNLALSILATAVVAVAFQPARERVERLANRLVYGGRATPYEVLAQFSDRVGSSYASEEILPRMARVLAEGTGAIHADVWVRMGERIGPAASFPQSEPRPAITIGLDAQVPLTVPGITRVVPVRHHGELLGALSVNKRPGERLTPVEDNLLNDLAAQAGLVLKNVRLTADLRARVEEISRQTEELKRSRQRIVAAQDGERRKLERNIHDGAQQHLVALTVKLRLAGSLARRDPSRALETVRWLEGDTEDALDTLRNLARGIYPHVLREHGLVAAIKADVSRMDVPIEISGEGIGRYADDLEAAVYFSCLEALQNASKYAAAHRITIRFEQGDGKLEFSIADDGKGFDSGAIEHGAGLQNMADRIETLGGKLWISTHPGSGTTVAGWVPARALALAN